MCSCGGGIRRDVPAMLAILEPASGVSFEQSRIALQVQRPADLVVDPVTHGLPSGTVAIDVAVLELQSCSGRIDCAESESLGRRTRGGVGVDCLGQRATPGIPRNSGRPLES
jgi:hypothetical protein